MNKLRFACHVTNASLVCSNQWLTARTEGRSVINNAFGLASMGHEVDIAFETFGGEKSNFDGINLVKNIDLNKEYDFYFTYNSPPRTQNYKHLIYTFDPTDHANIALADKMPQNTSMSYLFRRYEPIMSKIGIDKKYDMNFFPALYPIPCLKPEGQYDFVEFNFDSSKKTLNILCFICWWNNFYLGGDERIYFILKNLRDVHKYNINVTLLAGGIGNTPGIYYQKIVKEFNPLVITDNESLGYRGTVDLIGSSDICITKGAKCYPGNCAWDMVSLGKLMLYVTDSGPTNNINNLYIASEYFFDNLSSYDGWMKNLDRILKNPEVYYNFTKLALNDNRFPVWKEITNSLINKIIKK